MVKLVFIGKNMDKEAIFKALDNYRKENKGRTFKVKGYNDTFEINRKTIRSVLTASNTALRLRLAAEEERYLLCLLKIYHLQC